MIFGDISGEGGMVIPGITAKNDEEIPRIVNFAPSLPDVCRLNPVFWGVQGGENREPQGRALGGVLRAGLQQHRPGRMPPSRPFCRWGN